MTAKERKVTVAKIKSLLHRLTQQTEYIKQLCEDGMIFKAGPPGAEPGEDIPDNCLYISDDVLKGIVEAASYQEDLIHQLEPLFTELAGIYPPRYNDNLNDEMIKALHKEGKSVRAIARQMGCSPSTVSNRLAVDSQGE